MATLAAVIASTHHPFYYRASTSEGAQRPPFADENSFVSLRRAKVEVHSVAQQSLEPGYGYLRITGFSETTSDDVNHAIARLKRDKSR